jgi:hypothetical protein
MPALVTEHFVLQSARSATVSEAVGRMAVYLTCVSSSLVAFGFFAAAAFFASADGAGAAAALASTGMRAGVSEMFFTGASMIAAVTSILAGAGAALLLDVAGMPVPAAVIAGVAVALLVFGLQMMWMYRRGQRLMA